MKIEIFTQSAIKLIGNVIIYFDPFKIDKYYNDADYIFITHDHYDHYDEESIKKVLKRETTIIVPKILKDKIKKFNINKVIVEPNNNYVLDNIKFNTTFAYNINKKFHPREAKYVGYILDINNTTYYIMGDTDLLEENKFIKTDVCFVPIGGTYTMDVIDASKYINYIKPKIAIPIHYGSIVGSIDLKDEFKKLIDKDIKVDIYIEEELK